VGGEDVPGARNADATARAAAVHTACAGGPARAGHRRDRERENGSLCSSDPASTRGAPLRRFRTRSDTHARTRVPACGAVPRSGLSRAPPHHGCGRWHGYAQAGEGFGCEAAPRHCHSWENPRLAP